MNNPIEYDDAYYQNLKIRAYISLFIVSMKMASLGINEESFSELLCLKGFDLNIDHEDKPFFHHVIESNRKECLQLLEPYLFTHQLQNSAPEAQTLVDNPNTVFIYPSWDSGSVEYQCYCSQLIENDAIISGLIKKDILISNSDVVKAILGRNPKVRYVDISRIGKDGISALHRAIMVDDSIDADIVAFVLKRGLSIVNLPAQQGETPLMCAVANKRYAAMELLLAARAKILLENSNGANVLKLALASPDHTAFHILLKFGGGIGQAFPLDLLPNDGFGNNYCLFNTRIDNALAIQDFPNSYTDNLPAYILLSTKRIPFLNLLEFRCDELLATTSLNARHVNIDLFKAKLTILARCNNNYACLLLSATMERATNFRELAETLIVYEQLIREIMKPKTLDFLDVKLRQTTSPFLRNIKENLNNFASHSALLSDTIRLNNDLTQINTQLNSTSVRPVWSVYGAQSFAHYYMGDWVIVYALYLGLLLILSMAWLFGRMPVAAIKGESLFSFHTPNYILKHLHKNEPYWYMLHIACNFLIKAIGLPLLGADFASRFLFQAYDKINQLKKLLELRSTITDHAQTLNVEVKKLLLSLIEQEELLNADSYTSHDQAKASLTAFLAELSALINVLESDLSRSHEYLFAQATCTSVVNNTTLMLTRDAAVNDESLTTSHILAKQGFMPSPRASLNIDNDNNNYNAILPKGGVDAEKTSEEYEQKSATEQSF